MNTPVSVVVATTDGEERDICFPNEAIRSCHPDEIVFLPIANGITISRVSGCAWIVRKSIFPVPGSRPEEDTTRRWRFRPQSHGNPIDFTPLYLTGTSLKISGSFFKIFRTPTREIGLTLDGKLDTLHVQTSIEGEDISVRKLSQPHAQG